jgi:hypothetical protein
MTYTLVQHSAWVAKRDPQFQWAVETRSIQTKAQGERVLKAGGVIFTDYNLASEREYAENYPPHIQGIVPRCEGHFATAVLDGSPIYVPREQ